MNPRSKCILKKRLMLVFKKLPSADERKVKSSLKMLILLQCCDRYLKPTRNYIWNIHELAQYAWQWPPYEAALIHHRTKEKYYRKFLRSVADFIQHELSCVQKNQNSFWEFRGKKNKEEAIKSERSAIKILNNKKKAQT